MRLPGLDFGGGDLEVGPGLEEEKEEQEEEQEEDWGEALWKVMNITDDFIEYQK